MREIKYKVWHIEHKKWIHDELDIFLTSDGDVYEKYDYGYETCIRDITNAVEVLFFTGLKDKNGKEIYEGNVIKQEYTAIIKTDYDPVSYGLIDQETEEGHHIGEVVIIASKGVCMRKPLRYSLEDDKTEISNQYKNVAGYRCEVIGNVYDNPDLIQKAD